MLSLQNVETYYGYSHILHGVSLEVRKGEIVVLLGRNGVGKTTTMKTIMGVQPPKGGRIVFCGHEIAGKPPHENARRGIAFVPEDRRVIPTLSVYENLRLGALVRGRPDGIEESLETVFEYFPRLKERLNQDGGRLSGGEQQMLTIARAMMARPRLLLIDEPSEGLAPKIVREIMDIIRKLQEDGVTILLVEQHAELAMRLSSNLRAYIMEKGEIRMQGTLQDLAGRMEEVERYLGAKL